MNSLSHAPNLSHRNGLKDEKAMMTGRLIAIDDQGDVELRDGFIVVGRHPSCEVNLDSARISRIHCCIYTSGDRVFVRDLNSTNGIRVNGKLVINSELCHDDTLSIANMRYYCDLNSRTSSEPENDEVVTEQKSSRVKTWQKAQDSPTCTVEESELQKMEQVVKKLIHLEGVENCRVEIQLRWDESDNRNLTTEG